MFLHSRWRPIASASANLLHLNKIIKKIFFWRIVFYDYFDTRIPQKAKIIFHTISLLNPFFWSLKSSKRVDKGSKSQRNNVKIPFGWISSSKDNYYWNHSEWGSIRKTASRFTGEGGVHTDTNFAWRLTNCQKQAWRERGGGSPSREGDTHTENCVTLARVEKKDANYYSKYKRKKHISK